MLKYFCEYPLYWLRVLCERCTPENFLKYILDKAWCYIVVDMYVYGRKCYNRILLLSKLRHNLETEIMKIIFKKKFARPQNSSLQIFPTIRY